jgi:hypothetical protein
MIRRAHLPMSGRLILVGGLSHPDSLGEVPQAVRLASLALPWRDEDYPERESLE